MGQVTLPASGPVYVDTSSVIYEVEGIEPYRSAGLPVWDALDAGLQEVVTSELTLLEVLVKPLCDADAALVALYRNFLLGTIGLTASTVTRADLEHAASLRAQHNLRTPNVIHAATALNAGCTLFVTNDPDFRHKAHPAECLP